MYRSCIYQLASLQVLPFLFQVLQIRQHFSASCFDFKLKLGLSILTMRGQFP